MGTDFRAWSLENLAKFAFEATNKLSEQEKEIAFLRDDLKACMDAYRKLNVYGQEEVNN